MEKLKNYTKPYAWVITLTVLIKFGSAVFELMIPYLMEIMLDSSVQLHRVREIFVCGSGMILCALASYGCNLGANFMSAKSSGTITETLRHDLFCKIQTLSSRQMDSLTVSSAESRLTSDTYNINRLLTVIQRMGVRAPIMLIGGAGVMLSMDWKLAMVLLLLLPFIVLVTLYVTNHSVPLYARQQKVLDRMVETTGENIVGIRVIKSLGKTEYERKKFEKINQELTQHERKAGYITAVSNPASTFIMNFGLTLAVVFGAWRVQKGEISSGVIVAFLQYFTMILNATIGVTRIFMIWSKGEASARRVAEVLKLPEEMQPEDMQPEAPHGSEKEKAHIVFENVSFSYYSHKYVIDNLSFQLFHGQTLGIIGSTGSGKTTIVNLLMRFYDPESGKILVDGQDIRSMSYEVLRKKFGVVFQNDFLMEGTAADNVRFFRKLSLQSLNEAVSNAQAGFVKERGLESHVAIRGSNLSGGQKQRLLIARALAAEPEILILDDASSALDYQTDANLRRSLRKNYRNTTTILIAQRVSSICHADLIIVLSESGVQGIGSHEQLKRDCPTYREIAEAQMEREEPTYG